MNQEVVEYYEMLENNPSFNCVIGSELVFEPYPEFSIKDALINTYEVFKSLQVLPFRKDYHPTELILGGPLFMKEIMYEGVL